MKDVTITIYDKSNGQIIDQFLSDFEDMNELLSRMEDCYMTMMYHILT